MRDEDAHTSFFSQTCCGSAPRAYTYESFACEAERWKTVLMVSLNSIRIHSLQCRLHNENMLVPSCVIKPPISSKRRVEDGRRTCVGLELDGRPRLLVMEDDIAPAAMELLPQYAHAHACSARQNATFLEEWDPHNNIRGCLTFGEFASRVRAVRACLHAHGVLHGDRVAFLSYASLDYFVATVAVMATGATTVNLPWQQPLEQLAVMCRNVAAAYLIASRTFSAEAESLAAARAFSRRLLWLDERMPSTAHGRSGSHECLSRAAQAVDIDPSAPLCADALRPADFAVIMFTSGSTATPKSVPLSHAGLTWLFHAKAHAEAYNLHAPSPAAHGGTLCLLPCFHVLGFCNNFLFNLVAGVRAFCLAAPPSPQAAAQPRIAITPELLVRAVRELRPSVLTTVPWLAEQLALAASTSNETARLLSGLNYLLVGGAKVSPSCAATLAAKRIGLRSVCGATEVGGSIMIGRAADATLRMRLYPGVGCRLLPDAEHAISNAAAVASGTSGELDGQRVDSGAQGVLVLTGVRSVSPGYLDAGGRLNDEPLRGESCYNTRDIFHVHPDGWLSFVCRADDLLVSALGRTSVHLPKSPRTCSDLRPSPQLSSNLLPLLTVSKSC